MKTIFALACSFCIFSGVNAQWLNNDDCATAFSLTVGAACTAGDNFLATSGSDFSMSCGTTDAAVWFSFVCPPSGSVTISTDHAGTSFDTHINLLGAAAGDPTTCPGAGFMFEYGCDDDGGGTIAPLSSTLIAAGLVPGQTYWIQVDGFSGATGTYCIDILETLCTADAGTFTVNVTGGSTVVVGDTIWVCDNTVSCFEIISNNDFVLPPPQSGETSELMFALFNCPPSTPDPATDPCYTGLLWTGQDFSDCNPSAFGLAGTIFFVPITADDSDNAPDPNGVIHWDQNGDGCFDMGPAFSVQYLNEVLFSAVENFCIGEVEISVSGGSPEVSGDDYTIVSTGAGTIAGTPITHGGSITISGLVDGDSYSISVTDPLGCVSVFGGTFSGDNIAPTITCPSDITANNDPGSCDAAVAVPIPVTSDNCVVASLVNDFNGTGDASGTYPIGITTVNWTVTDAVGLTGTCSMTITINDNENPTSICQDISVNLDPTGNVSILASDVDAGSSDNCSISLLSLDITSFTCSDVGVNVVTLTVEDASGNNASCASNVTVVDPNVPAASTGPDDSMCEGDSFTLTGSSGGSATSGSWGSSSDGSFSSGGTDPTGTYTPGPIATAAGTVDLTWTTDLSPCISDAATLTLTIVPTPTFGFSFASAPTSCGGSDGAITISGLDPSTIYDLSYDDDGVQVDSLGITTDASGNLVISGLDAGSYDSWSVDLAGCTGTAATVITLTDPAAPVISVTLTLNLSTCGGSDGSITISGLSPSTVYDLHYDDDGTQIDSVGIMS
ncbi:MAG: HYR domain-containing protein, partial [Flavobacteriales bacterium]|nr:HYR domain-containing protein [Flavobacteriales bacterium]